MDLALHNDVTSNPGGINIGLMMDRIRTCVEEAVRPFAEVPPRHTQVYNSLCGMLRELPEYIDMKEKVDRLETTLAERDAELARMKKDMDELSTEGEEVVLEVREGMFTKGESSSSALEQSDASDSEENSEVDDGQPTFPTMVSNTKTVSIVPGSSSVLGVSASEADASEADASEADASEADASEADRSEDEGSNQSAAVGECESKGKGPYTAAMLAAAFPKERIGVLKWEMDAANATSDPDPSSGSEGEEEEEEEEEEVEEKVISGTLYYCSSTTIYECTETGEVGDEVGVFRNKVPLFHNLDEGDSAAELV
jgi:hypothetical protein